MESRQKILALARERAGDLRDTGWWGTFFVRSGNVPVDLQGRPFSPYGVKLAAMLNGLDEKGEVPLAIASSRYEFWLPGSQGPPPSDRPLFGTPEATA